MCMVRARGHGGHGCLGYRVTVREREGVRWKKKEGKEIMVGGSGEGVNSSPHGNFTGGWS